MNSSSKKNKFLAFNKMYFDYQCVVSDFCTNPNIKSKIFVINPKILLNLIYGFHS